MSGKPTVISTFAGTGGSSLGYKWAGFEELLAIDFDAHAVECFKLNFPEVPVWHKSVTDVTGEEILKFCNIKKGELDVFDGSPPCQGFSIAGKREVRDPRNDLFVQYVRLIDELHPKVFVMENVTGMVKGKMRGRFIEIMKTLKGLPYRVKCKQMNSKWYGVPQSRERLIFMGVRNDLNKDPQWPIPSKNIITCRNALTGVVNKTFLESNEKYKKQMNKIDAGKNLSSLKEYKGSHFSYIKIPKNKPMQTLNKSVCFGRVSAWHYEEDRNISIEEAKRLCSFPDEWKLTGKYQQQWVRLGNAVMPKFMEAIATTIKKDILNG